MTLKKVLIGTGAALILVTLLLGVIGLGGSSDKGGSRTLYTGKVGAYSFKLDRAPDPPAPDIPARMSVLVQTVADGKPVDDVKVTVVPNMPGMPMPGMTDMEATHTGSGTYQASVPVTMEGYWFFDVKVENSRLGPAQFRFEDTVEKPATPWLLIALIVVGVTVGAGLVFAGMRGNRPDDDGDDDDDYPPSTKIKLKLEREEEEKIDLVQRG